MGDPGQPLTELAIGLRVRVFDVPFDLRSTVGGPEGWTFAGKADFRAKLSRLLATLQGPVGDDDAWFAEAPLADVDITSLSVTYRAEAKTFTLRSDFDVRIGDCPSLELAFLFATGGDVPDGEGAVKGKILAGLFSRSPIDFASMLGEDSGLIGRFLGGLDLDRVGIFYASDPQVIDGALIDSTAGEPVDFAGGLSVMARLGSNGDFTDIALPPPPSEQEPPAADAVEEVPAVKPRHKRLATSGGPLRYWKPVDKTIGPLELRRIGGEWDNGKLGILLDAAVSLAGLRVGLAGLAVKVPPSKLSTLEFSDLEFALDGLELAFSRGPVSISGALLKTFEGGRVGYAGQASIRAANFSIAAIGAYSTTAEDQPAFFIFGAYAGILGGPPCFVVTGIAAGFGYNRAINLPDIDEVRDFPLVSIVLGPPERDPASALDQFGSQDRFPAVTGQYWIAAGVKFTSFKLVDAFALVTVQFGARFEIALLGVATLRQPPAPATPALVYVEMALKVRFAPDDGLLSVMAVLTGNSFLFDTRCKLTGGFAFCVWMKPTDSRIENRAGDFVLTLGGYHPKFQVPAHYPKVPRVGFNWQLPECGVTIKGEAYFALTPSFIMAGARLSAVFRSGDFSAWFEAHVDFLIGWAPLHYEAEVGVRIGAAFVLRIGSIAFTLSFELAANLRIWGPPFAGEAYIDLGIVAFTVPLGDRATPRVAPAISWPEFRETFLPPEPLAIAVVAGLVAEIAGKPGFIIVNPSELCLAVQSFVPIVSLDGAIAAASDEVESAPPTLGIRPMAKTELRSNLHLAFSREVDGKLVGQEGNVVRRQLRSSVPEALWSSEPMPKAGPDATLSANVIKDVPMGVQILPAECRKYRSREIAVSILSEPVDLPGRPDHAWVDARYVKPADRRDQFIRAWKAPERDGALAEAIRDFGFAAPETAVTVGKDFPNLWLATPDLVPIGMMPAPQHGA
jgi:hypothetical protein